MAIVVPIVSEWNPRGLNRAVADIQAADTKMGKVGAAAAAAAPAAAMALAGIGAAAVYAAGQASKLEQAEGAVSAVFKEQAGQVMEAAKAAQAIGLSQAQYGQEAAVLGAKLKGLGTAQGELAPQTDKLISLGADLAAQFGGSTSDSVSALSSLLSGEADPIERYGVSIKQSDVNARLAAQGLSGLEGEARKQAETQARLALLFEQTADAQGAAGRESDTVAARQQRLKATVENLAASFGEKLLPHLEKMAAAGEKALAWAAENEGAVQAIVAGVAALAAGIVTLNVAFKAMEVARAAATAVKALNAALLGNPVVLVVMAILALIAIIIYAYNKFDWFKAGVQAVWNAILTAVRVVVDWFKTYVWPVIQWVINAIMGYYRFLWNVVQIVWNGIMAAVRVVVNWFQTYVSPVLKSVGDAIGAAFRWLKSVIENVWDGIMSAVRWAAGVVNGAMNGISGVIEGIKGAWTSFRDTVQGVWDSITGAVQRAVDFVRDKIQSMKDALANVPLVGGLFDGDSRATLAVGYTFADGPATYSSSGGLGAAVATMSAPIIVNINGALDPIAVGRQVEQLVDGYRTAVGRPGLAAVATP